MKGAAGAFNRLTGERVPQDRLKTYADALRAYHLSCESKFENGEAWDCGETRRRHIVAKDIVFVGKEGNGIGEFGGANDTHEPVAEFATQGGGDEAQFSSDA